MHKNDPLIGLSFQVTITSSKPFSVLIGDYISLVCSLNSSSSFRRPSTFTWFHINSSSILTEALDTLTLPSISLDQLGVYQCNASNSGFSGSAEVTLDSASEFSYWNSLMHIYS